MSVRPKNCCSRCCFKSGECSPVYSVVEFGLRWETNEVPLKLEDSRSMGNIRILPPRQKFLVKFSQRNFHGGDCGLETIRNLEVSRWNFHQWLLLRENECHQGWAGCHNSSTFAAFIHILSLIINLPFLILILILINIGQDAIAPQPSQCSFLFYLFTRKVRVISHKSELCSHFKTYFEEQ